VALAHKLLAGGISCWLVCLVQKLPSGYHLNFLLDEVKYKLLDTVNDFQLLNWLEYPSIGFVVWSVYPAVGWYTQMFDG
jgi:hypothetical protein